MATATHNGTTFNSEKDILTALQAGKLDMPTALSMLEEMRVKASSGNGPTVKIGEKGGFSIRLGGKWPKCFFASELVKFLANLPEILNQLAALDLSKASLDKADMGADEFRAYVQSYAKRLK